MAAHMRPATLGDIGSVLPMLEDFYHHGRLPFERHRSLTLLEQLVSDERLGRLIVFDRHGTLAGYMVLGFGFSLEFGGRDAMIDELYVKPEERGRGLGTAALDAAADICRALGIAAIHLEADHVNQRAHELYLRSGFQDHERHLMTRWL